MHDKQQKPLARSLKRAGAMDEIPRDRVIDGVDQTGMLLLGDANGRADYVHLYDGTSLKAVVKNI